MPQQPQAILLPHSRVPQQVMVHLQAMLHLLIMVPLLKLPQVMDLRLATLEATVLLQQLLLRGPLCSKVLRRTSHRLMWKR
jgi:hypothetical protein